MRRARSSRRRSVPGSADSTPRPAEAAAPEPAPAHTYDYAIIRIVPRVERGEMINVGVILSCPAVSFLEARIELDEARLLAFDAGLDLDEVRAHLDTIPITCRGGAAAGPIGALPQRARFHWLVAPRSTII